MILSQLKYTRSTLIFLFVFIYFHTLSILDETTPYLYFWLARVQMFTPPTMFWLIFSKALSFHDLSQVVGLMLPG